MAVILHKPSPGLESAFGAPHELTRRLAKRHRAERGVAVETKWSKETKQDKARVLATASISSVAVTCIPVTISCR